MPKIKWRHCAEIFVAPLCRNRNGSFLPKFHSNPPYSAGQNSGNDNNANLKYQSLDESIRKTYADNSTATLKNALYDSYVRAIRWASDRVGKSGVIGFVSNAGFIEANTTDGLRKCLADEFSSIYVFHLRGNARTAGEMRRKEKDNVFGQGTRTPIAISILIKNPKATEHGKILFHDIGDYLSQSEKLEKIESFKSIQGIANANGWRQIFPDEHHDWINQRDNSFSEHISLGDKKDKSSIVLFENYSNGIKTNRDAWVYNYSSKNLVNNLKGMIDFYNQEVDRFMAASKGLAKESQPDPEVFVMKDATKISWTREVYADVRKGHRRELVSENIVQGLYRPFTKQWIYFNQHFNNCVYQMPRIFPNSNLKNRVIALVGLGTPKEFSAIMTDVVTDLQLQANGQCFPLKLYELTEEREIDLSKPGLFDDESTKAANTYKVKDGITDAGLKHFQDAYPDQKINKEDLFYYIYGLLHSDDYKSRYADNLTKELPRIPRVKTTADFWAFSTAGRALADLHTEYDEQQPYPVQLEGGALLLSGFTPQDFRVEQMKFAKGKNGEKHDKTRVIYNHKITMSGIPLEAYEYVVNGKPALEWVMERQGVSEHKDSGIINDANLWATETMKDASYPLKLFQRVITVSLKTMEIVRSLPRI